VQLCEAARRGSVAEITALAESRADVNTFERSRTDQVRVC
jgi:hypothetical protein